MMARTFDEHCQMVYYLYIPNQANSILNGNRHIGTVFLFTKIYIYIYVSVFTRKSFDVRAFYDVFGQDFVICDSIQTVSRME